MPSRASEVTQDTCGLRLQWNVLLHDWVLHVDQLQLYQPGHSLHFYGSVAFPVLVYLLSALPVLLALWGRVQAVPPRPKVDFYCTETSYLMI